jgi:limonene-1,2-epoxide hydrolase
MGDTVSASSSEIVSQFIHALERKEIDIALALAADDIEYHNIPMDKVNGVGAVREFLEGFLAGSEGLEWVIHHQLADGDLVMNERTDRFKMNGRWLELPVVGVFELRAGKIAFWRDYFDLQMFMSQMEAAT